MWKNISALRVTGIISYRVAPTTSGASRPVSYELKVSNRNSNEFQQQHHYELRFSLKKNISTEQRLFAVQHLCLVRQLTLQIQQSRRCDLKAIL